MTAIITCGETRASLSATRALGRAGLPVAIAASKRPSLAMWSRFASSSFLTNDPKLCAQAFAQQIGEELKARYGLCAFSGTDDGFWALSRFRDVLPVSARRILPPHISVVRSLDHEALHHFAESLAIPCAPLIRIPEGSDDDEILERLKGLAFPQLFRPVIPWLEREDGTRRLNKRFVVKSDKHLYKILSQSPEMIKNGVLVSAYETTKAVSYFGVCDKGQVLVEGFQERLNEQEPYNEIATLAATIEPVPVIRKYAQTLLQALLWQGPFKVEFIKEKKSTYRLISLIGRLWGSLQLAISSGLNIPLISYRLAEGTITKALLKNAQARVKMRWLVGDTTSKFLNIGQLLKNTVSVGNNLTGLWHAKSWLGRQKVQTCYDVFDVQDPMPFFYELQNRTWKRAFGGKDERKF